MQYPGLQYYDSMRLREKQGWDMLGCILSILNKSSNRVIIPNIPFQRKRKSTFKIPVHLNKPTHCSQE